MSHKSDNYAKLYRCFFPEHGIVRVTEDGCRDSLEFETEDLAVLFDMWQDMSLNDESEVIVGYFWEGNQFNCKMRIHRFKRTLTKADYDPATGETTYEMGFDLTNTITDVEVRKITITKGKD